MDIFARVWLAKFTKIKPPRKFQLVQWSLPAFTLGPVCRDFPRQSHSVDARWDFSQWSHQTCWVRGRKSDLGLVIDIAQLFSSNVRMRELWWLGDLTHSRNHSAVIVPGKRGHSMIVWTVGHKKDKTSPNCPRQTGPSLNAGIEILLHVQRSMLRVRTVHRAVVHANNSS